MRPVLRYASLCLLSALLAACTQPPPKPVKPAKIARAAPVKPAKPLYKANEYISHLAIAHMALAQKVTPDPVDLDVIEGYNTQPAQPERQPLVVIDYTFKGKKKAQHAIALDPQAEEVTGAALRSIAGLLEQKGCVLHDIRLVTVTLPPSVDGTSANLPVQERVQIQQANLLAGAEALPPLDEARAQLRLLRFFIDNRFRDAAYLTADNIKKQLAAALQADIAAETAVSPLSQELETLENRLHQDMPFTL